ncbi:MAG: hypothetical protein IH589_20255 [Anaerolineales bacterium]|nr:hypothetical protein [Anaerolineales bacterium]
MLIWYLGPMNKLVALDYIGSHGNGRPEFFIPISIVLIALAFIGRTRQIRTSAALYALKVGLASP